MRKHLLEPLAVLGLARPRGVTAAQQAAREEALVERLAWMSPENLCVLADAVASHAAATGGVWPLPTLIEGWALGLQRRPLLEAKIVNSWLASIEGPPARAAGVLVHLWRWLRKHRVPPTEYDKLRISEAAADDRRLLMVYRERIERDQASASDRAFVEAWLRDEAEALAIVAAGEAGRRAKEAAA